jgi:hypothetical protein
VYIVRRVSDIVKDRKINLKKRSLICEYVYNSVQNIEIHISFERLIQWLYYKRKYVKKVFWEFLKT